MNAADGRPTHVVVAEALERGYALRVELDPGELVLSGDDLRAEWEALAPGEGFMVLEVIR